MDVKIEKIEAMIYIIRDQKVMLDSDLASLYGVEVKRLNEQVRRNLKRFPLDFMFECSSEELDDLRSQFATANGTTNWNHKRRSSPMLFTENGVAMLSSVLNSERAIEVNIMIMRTFTKLRSYFMEENKLEKRVKSLETGANKIFKIVFERLENVEEKLELYSEAINPKLPKNRRKIGLNRDPK